MLDHPIFHDISIDWCKKLRGGRNIQHSMLGLHWHASQ